MSIDQHQALREGIDLAMQAERDAARFYADAAEQTTDPRGRDLFRQLARFEQAHFTALKKFRENLGHGAFEGYRGEELIPEKPAAPPLTLSEIARRKATDAVDIAIKTEEQAAGAYRRLAGEANDPRLREFFTRLASDEELHRKVLEDQFLALTNQGFWIWGE